MNTKFCILYCMAQFTFSFCLLLFQLLFLTLCLSHYHLSACPLVSMHVLGCLSISASLLVQMHVWLLLNVCVIVFFSSCMYVAAYVCFTLCFYASMSLPVNVCFKCWFICLFISVVSCGSFSKSLTRDKVCKLAMAGGPLYTASVALKSDVTMHTCIVPVK